VSVEDLDLNKWSHLSVGSSKNLMEGFLSIDYNEYNIGSHVLNEYIIMKQVQVPF